MDMYASFPFATTYSCQSQFISLLSIMKKSRNHLNPSELLKWSNMQTVISKKVPRLDKIESNKQERKANRFEI